MSANPENMVGDRPSLVKKFANKYDIDPKVLMATLKATCFRVPEGEVSDEQMVALLVVADQYNLNPFTKEIYAFPDKHKGIVPVVSVDGWVRIINEHKDYNGYDVILPDEQISPIPGERPPAWEWVSIRLHRRNVENTPTLTEYLDECYRPPIKKTGNNGPYQVNGPWQTHPKRFLRHKALIQAARIVFGFAGIYDEDEAARILEGDKNRDVVAEQGSRTQNATERLRKQLSDQAGTGGLEIPGTQPATQKVGEPAGNATTTAEMQRAQEAANKHEPKKPTFKYGIAEALKYLRDQLTVDTLRKAYQQIEDDYDFSGREMPIDIEAIYRDLKEDLESKETRS